MANTKLHKIILSSLAILGGTLSAGADDPMGLASRMAYHEEFDPTTVFLNIAEHDQHRHDQFVADIINYAKGYLGKPYRSGSKGPNAFDCSGFTSFVFRNFDIKLAASSSDQYLQGEFIDFMDARPGDLVFFSGRGVSNTRVGHVGLVVDVDDEDGTITFIHASNSGGVRYDTYPDYGYYSKRYIGLRRVIAEDAQ